MFLIKDRSRAIFAINTLLKKCLKAEGRTHESLVTNTYHTSDNRIQTHFPKVVHFKVFHIISHPQCVLFTRDMPYSKILVVTHSP